MIHLLLFFLLLWQTGFCKERPTSTSSRHIALLVIPDWPGETSFAYRVQIACKNLGWKADIINIPMQAEKLREESYDFVINLVPVAYDHPPCKNYLAVFHPRHHYFNRKGHLLSEYHCYDGYLLSFEPHPKDNSFGRQGLLPSIRFYPSVQWREYRKVDPLFLFHICSAWGDRFFKEHFKKCFKLLSNEPYVRLYGAREIQESYPKAYQGRLPYDNEALFDTTSDAGVCLVLHSHAHNAHGVPSGRIFEAAASSAVIISDLNPFVLQQFEDSVLYVDTHRSGETIYQQINSMMTWIQTHKEEALAKARKAHEIYKEKFLLEDQLLQLEQFHKQLSGQ